jgi:hypothetical protein
MLSATAGLIERNAGVPEDRALMLKTMTSAAVFGAAFLAAHAALAFEGRYVAGDKAYRQDLTITKRADGGFDVTAVVGTEGCSGLIDARGAAHGDMLKAEAGFEGGTCVLALRRTKSGVKVQAENCASFHGASCEFDGDYRKRR